MEKNDIRGVKTFNAKKALRAAVYTVIAVKRIDDWVKIIKYDRTLLIRKDKGKRKLIMLGVGLVMSLSINAMSWSSAKRLKMELLKKRTKV